MVALRAMFWAVATASCLDLNLVGACSVVALRRVARAAVDSMILYRSRMHPSSASMNIPSPPLFVRTPLAIPATLVGSPLRFHSDTFGCEGKRRHYE